MSGQGKANYEAYRESSHGKSLVSGAVLPPWDGLPHEIQAGWNAGADAVELWLSQAPADEDAQGNEPAKVMHLMTIEMGAWCGASGPGNGRASSQWREVTCPACTAKGMTWLRALVWDMLQVLPASREALAFALRAGRLGVTDEQGTPLTAACGAGEDL